MELDPAVQTGTLVDSLVDTLCKKLFDWALKGFPSHDVESIMVGERCVHNVIQKAKLWLNGLLTRTKIVLTWFLPCNVATKTVAAAGGENRDASFTVLTWNVLAREFTKHMHRLPRVAQGHCNPLDDVETLAQTASRYMLASFEILARAPDAVLLQEVSAQFFDASVNPGATALLARFIVAHATNARGPGTAILLCKQGALVPTGKKKSVATTNGTCYSATLIEVAVGARGKQSQQTLWFASIHLPCNKSKQESILRLLADALRADVRGPSSPPCLLVAGDFNAGPEAVKNLQRVSCLGGLKRIDACLGPTGLSANLKEPRTIDHAFVSPGLLVASLPMIEKHPSSPYAPFSAGGSVPRTSSPATVVGASDHVWMSFEVRVVGVSVPQRRHWKCVKADPKYQHEIDEERKCAEEQRRLIEEDEKARTQREIKERRGAQHILELAEARQAVEAERKRFDDQQRQIENLQASIQCEVGERRNADHRAQEAQRVIQEAEARRQSSETKRKRAEVKQLQMVEEARTRAAEERKADIRRQEADAREALEAEEARVREEKVKRKREAQAEHFLKQHGYASLNAKRILTFGRYEFALHTAVKHNPELVPLLLDLGAEPSRKNSRGQTAHEYSKLVKSSAEPILRSTP